ncbi:hypothetical protein KY321_03320, partial [Candidatus Woesearchaeota archaeon]|nr:hypothetical protein [Candidatus Woesearchaeota archaeon]
MILSGNPEFDEVYVKFAKEATNQVVAWNLATLFTNYPISLEEEMKDNIHYEIDGSSISPIHLFFKDESGEILGYSQSAYTT